MGHDSGHSMGYEESAGKEESNQDNAHDNSARHDVESHNMAGGHHHGGGERPMFAIITVAVCHCGAGCVLGDIIGEWIVCGTGASINGRTLCLEYLIGTRILTAIVAQRTMVLLKN